ncbi:hypothetical protein EPUS_04816 [Endocarpon pusillum Z07020]|uniref:Uncharacterized protein n=1 Tax=Endocarpon pusillum (strain Z07020 / HMAS-L-300199) TaxID=1263415 RepID=U1GKN4_ENDPU|nr:uncharacterized protein EPUS_04816 [Endocarpon pusillum Z07020]ERF72763.1 hypothetical protein EPUS_04816 [Endocarpon pusillum Z07020]
MSRHEKERRETDRGDLAAIRILVYFPDDIPRAVEAIKSSEIFEIPEAVVSFSRTRFDQRARDIAQHKKGVSPNYTDGPCEERLSSANDIIQRWKNSRYQAVHLYVRVRTRSTMENAIADQQEVEREKGAGPAIVGEAGEFS